MDTANQNDAWQKEVPVIARLFVMMLNGAMLYGCGHPNVARNAVSFCEQLNASFSGRDMITIIVANGTFMIEDWPLDKSFNTGKILAHFDKLGLSSISFERGVDPNAIINLVGLIGDTHGIDICKAGLAEAVGGSIPLVRINYILFGKIRADEVVVKEADARATGGWAAQGAYGMPVMAGDPVMQGYTPGVQDSQVMPGYQMMPWQPEIQNVYPAPSTNVTPGSLSRESVAQIEEVLTLSSLLEKPKEVSDILARTDTSRFRVDELQSAFGKIKSEIDESSGIGVDTLLQSLHGLKKDLYEAIEVQKTTGRMMRSAAVINKELNDLTSLAIVKLVREEYKSGKTPLNRLAHTIRRMLPGNAELMNILPHLKESLLADGMTLGDYLELVRMLGLKMDSEALSDSLKEAAESMGASVTDLVAAIQSKPEEAARLILLASEIRQSTGGDASKLPDMLTGYIEEVSSKMAVEACGADSGNTSDSLKNILAQLQTQMFSQLAQQEQIPRSVLMDVRQRLTDRFRESYDAANGAFMDNRKPQAPAPAVDAGTASVKIKLPAEALNANNLFFLMNKEIKRSLRYKTPFATIFVSIDKIIRPDGARPLKPEDTAELLPQLFVLLEPLLRDVDLIGRAGSGSSPELLMLLPMTGEEGTAVVRERIINKTKESAFTVAGHTVGIAVKASLASPNENTQDLKSYMALVQKNHRNEK
ncbi:MAG: hypothetical protein FWB94_00760 [Chitinispirillia bacterium]|nr:hypothetical protein [Chitinispirillia bacterium]